jgi:hypothetical protein
VYRLYSTFKSFQSSQPSVIFLPDFGPAPSISKPRGQEAARNKHMKRLLEGSTTDNNDHSRSSTRKARILANMFASSHLYARIQRLRRLQIEAVDLNWKCIHKTTPSPEKLPNSWVRCSYTTRRFDIVVKSSLDIELLGLHARESLSRYFFRSSRNSFLLH